MLLTDARLVTWGTPNRILDDHALYIKDGLIKDIGATAELIRRQPAWHIVFGFHESMITTTMVGGKILMEDRQLLTLDEEAVATKAHELARRVWKRYRENVK